jgi:C4-dicarboxylate transporter DctM subunit
MTITILFAVFFALVLFRLPIAFSLLGASLAAMHFLGQGALPAAQKMVVSADSFPLLAIPFFIAAGELMNRGGVTSRLVNFAYSIVGHIRGSLALINVVASMFFAGVSGSAVADTAAIGSAIVPPMIKKGYDKGFTAAVTAASGTIGMIIPPSIAMVILGITANISIGKLFLGGIIPGILIGLVQCVYSFYYSVRRKYPIERNFFLKQVWITFYQAIFPSLTPVIIVFGVVGGVFTATEAGATAVVYALILGLFVHKELTFKDIVESFIDTAVITGMVMLLVMTASSFGWLITMEQIPGKIAIFFMNQTQNPFLIMVLINFFVLVVGMFLDPTPCILILVPILFPVAAQFGIDPIHFGIIFVINMAIAEITPPVGVVLFTTCAICNISLTDIIKPIIPFILFMVLLLLIVTYFPLLVMYLPHIFMPG